MEYQKCPVCNGNGSVSAGFYSSGGDWLFRMTSSATAEICRTCEGKGIIFAPRIEDKSLDRLTYNPDGETIDEVVLTNASVHLEQLDDVHFMLIVENADHYWHLRVGSRSGRAKVDAWLFEGDEVRE